MNHELVLLLKRIDWDAGEMELEAEFAEYYCADNGRLSVAIRRMVGMVRKKGKNGEDEMVGMMLLKNSYKLSDEGVVARWRESPYMQDFTGEWGEGRQEGVPEASGDGTNPIDMTKFRKRIGAEGVELSGEDIQAVPVICIRSKKEHRMIRNYLKRTRGEAPHTLWRLARIRFLKTKTYMPVSAHISRLSRDRGLEGLTM